MCNTIIKQTNQISRELADKNNILYKFVDSNISKILQNASYKVILLVSRQGNHQMFQKILMVVF